VVKPCWAEAPAARPDFDAICTSIGQFRCPSTAGDEYYTAGQESEETYINEFNS